MNNRFVVLILCILIILPFTLQAQIAFIRSYTNKTSFPAIDFASLSGETIAQLTNGDYLLCCNNTLLKCNSKGEILVAKKIDNARIFGVVKATSGAADDVFMYVSNTSSWVTSTVVRMSGDFSIQWQTTLPIAAGSDFVFMPCNDGGVLVSSINEGVVSTDKDKSTFIKLSTSGAIQWQKKFSVYSNVSKNYGGFRKHVACQLQSGNFIIAGVSRINYKTGQNSDDMCFLGVSSNGTLQWSKYLYNNATGYTTMGGASSFLPISENQLRMVFQNSSLNGYNAYYTELDSSGAVRWVRGYNTTGVQASHLKKSGEMYFANEDKVITHTNSDGILRNAIKLKNLPGTSFSPTCLITTNDNGVATLAYYSISPFDLDFTPTLVKCMSDVTTTPNYYDVVQSVRDSLFTSFEFKQIQANDTTLNYSSTIGSYSFINVVNIRDTLYGNMVVASVAHEQKRTTDMLQAYPNPTNGVVSITIPENQTTIHSETTVEVYSALGQLVLRQAATQPTTTITLTALPHGVYNVRCGAYHCTVVR
ncbi:MAG: T9SS type A sorting domain-containing protein [Candidatus Kapabacteria bacterium]|nr:T9SS type A sorting domain-containing protein [Candidatus Kapabacteria bacterium]